MGLFSGVANAEVTGGGVYFLPGKYRVEIEAVKTVKSSKNGKAYWVNECLILESNCPERPAGTNASQVIEIGNVMGPINIKAFVAAATGIDPTADDVNDLLIAEWEALTEVQMNIEEICEYVCDEEENPLQGLIMDLTTANVKTKKNTDFTKHFWKLAPDQENEEEA